MVRNYCEIELWKNVTEDQWQDWRWQLPNRITIVRISGILADLKEYGALSLSMVNNKANVYIRGPRYEDYLERIANNLISAMNEVVVYNTEELEFKNREEWEPDFSCFLEEEKSIMTNDQYNLLIKYYN